MENTNKSSSSICQNKTGLIFEKRKSTIINNKVINNYASKPSQYSHIDSLIKRRINTKKNNSVLFVSGYQKIKDSFIRLKNNENIYNNNLELNTSNFNLL